MSKEQFEQQVKEIYESGTHTGRKKARIKREFFDDMTIYYPNLKTQNISELYFWILKGLSNYPKCPVCSKNITKYRSPRDGYNSEFCSIKCSLASGARNEKTRQTCLKRYGVEYPNQSSQIRDKTEQTCLKRYGFKYVGQNVEVKAKIAKVMLDRYGDDYSKTRRKYKKFVLPSGKEVSIQGYENIVITELLKTLSEEDIGIHAVPKIFYEYEGNNKFHLPDIYLPKTNMLIEVKSPYTLNIKFDQNIAKQKAAQEQGYSYEIWVCDGKKIIQKM